MKSSQWTLPVLAPFNFRSTAFSHGWVLLAPNHWEEENEAVHTVLQLSDGTIVSLELRDGSEADKPGLTVQVKSQVEIKSSHRSEINDALGRMFRADEDLSEFYLRCQESGEPWNQLPAGTGRLLRSPTLFEDVIKTICTTNIQWSGTVSMVANLVRALGDSMEGQEEISAFPSVEAVAAASEQGLAEARLGYRAAYIAGFAQGILNGGINLEAMEDPNLPTAEVRKQLLAIKGVGDYAANTLLMLLGRYEHLAYDTAMRDFVGKKYFQGANPGEVKALEIYADWGKWKYLAYWFDLYPGG